MNATFKGLRPLGYELAIPLVDLLGGTDVGDVNSRIVAAVNVSAPKARIGPQLDKLARFVARSTTDLSAALGHQR